MRRRWQVVVLVAACVPLAEHAAADWLDRLFPPGVPGFGTAPGVTVASRLHPEATPAGIRSGAFVLSPALEQSVGYDSNVLGGNRPLGSWVAESRPSVLLSSGWSRHAVGVFVSADDRRELELPGQSRTDWIGTAGGRLDLGRDHLTLAAAAITGHEDRTALDALPADRPVPFRVQDLRASYAWTDGRWTVTPNLEAASWHYGDASFFGRSSSQTYRDRSVQQGGATISYEQAPQRSLVVELRAIGQSYPHPLPNAPSLNSTGYQAIAGLDYADDDIWRYRLLLGAERRSFAAANYGSQTALITEGEIAWQPTGMTTVTATLGRSIEDAAQAGVAGFTLSSAKLALDHELRRDVLLHAAVTAQQAAFLQGGWQRLFGFGLSATWLASRQLRVSASYGLSTLHGPGPAAASGGGAAASTGDYTRGLGLLTVRLAL